MSYNLGLYQPLKQGGAFIADITGVALNWSRSIRLQGGFWLGDFTIIENPNIQRQWYYDYLGAHIEEHSPSLTWEGFIYAMDYDTSPEGGNELEVSVAGYIHHAADLVVPDDLQTGTRNPVHVWIKALIDELDDDFLTAGNMEINVTGTEGVEWIKVQAYTEDGVTIWEEMLKCAELGDQAGNLWHVHCGPGRKVHYSQISNTPSYYTRSGLRVRKTHELLHNAVIGIRNLDDGEYPGNSLFDEAINPYSIERYGKRQKWIKVNYGHEAVAEMQRDRYLHEESWPWSRVLATGEQTELTASPGSALTFSQWQIQPAVVRDIGWFIDGPDEPDASMRFFQDRRDFLVEEVKADQSGISMKTMGFSEADMWEARKRMPKHAKYLPYGRRGPKGQRGERTCRNKTYYSEK